MTAETQQDRPCRIRYVGQMTIGAEYVPMAVEILVAEPAVDIFADLSATAEDQNAELAVSDARDVTAAADLFFDVDSAVHVVRSVTAVITGVGGAAKVIDWVIGKIRERRSRSIVLRSGTTRVTIKIGDDTEEARRVLKAALKAL